MSEIVRRPGALTRRPAELELAREPAWSTRRLSFEGEVVTWDQLPRETRRAARRAGTVVAEAVHPEAGPSPDGARPVQVARAWRAHLDGLVLAEVVRPVAPALGGGFHPTGAWEHRTVEHHDVVGATRRRRGLVPVADELAERVGGRGGLRTSVPDEHAQAAEAWALLPAAVRGPAELAVPEPDTWLGHLVQVTSPSGVPISQDLVVLRMADVRAVVIHATRSLTSAPDATAEQERARMAAEPWLVEQIGYDLVGPAVPTLPGR